MKRWTSTVACVLYLAAVGTQVAAAAPSVHAGIATAPPAAGSKWAAEQLVWNALRASNFPLGASTRRSPSGNSIDGGSIESLAPGMYAEVSCHPTGPRFYSCSWSFGEAANSWDFFYGYAGATFAKAAPHAFLAEWRCEGVASFCAQYTATASWSPTTPAATNTTTAPSTAKSTTATTTTPTVTTPAVPETDWVTNQQAALAAYAIVRQPPGVPPVASEIAQDALDGFLCPSGNALYGSNVTCSWTASVMWGGWGSSPPDPNGGPWYGGADSAQVTRAATGSVTVKVDGDVCTMQQNSPGTCT